MDKVDEALQYVRAKATRDAYRRSIEVFLEEEGMNQEAFLELAGKDPRAASARIVASVRAMSARGVGASGVAGRFCAIRAFLDYSDVDGLNWKKLRKVLPARPGHGDDRAPTLEEIRRILKVCGLRMRACILIMASSGVRIGSFDYFLLRDFEAVREGGRVLAGRLTVYRGEHEEYSTYVSAEAVEAIEDYQELRRRGGETLGPNSPLVRDEWDWRDGDVLKPKRLNTIALNKGLQVVLEKAGLKQREFKQAHGFRKFFKTRAEQAMKSAYVEILMGHSLGVTDSYLKPTEKELLGEYLKAAPLLTITEADELKRELSKKDEEVSTLRREVSSIATTLQLMQLELQELRRRKG